MFDPVFQRTQTERTGDSTRPFQFNRTAEHEDRIISLCAQVQEEYFDKGLDKNDIKSSNVTKRDILRLRAFHAAYKLLHHLSIVERFLTAICQTSDDMFKKADKAKIKQWELEYG